MLPWTANSLSVSALFLLSLFFYKALPALIHSSQGRKRGVPNRKGNSWPQIFRYLLWISAAPIVKFTAHIAQPVRAVGFLIRGTKAKWHFPQEQLRCCLWEWRALISGDISECPQECLPSPVYQSLLSDRDRCTASKWKRIMSWAVLLAAALPPCLHTLPAKLLTEWLLFGWQESLWSQSKVTDSPFAGSHGLKYNWPSKPTSTGSASLEWNARLIYEWGNSSAAF